MSTLPVSAKHVCDFIAFHYSRSGSYTYSDTPLYSQATGSTYFESQSGTGQVSSPTSSPTVASSPMYVSGGQILANATPPGSSAGVPAAVTGASGSGTYVIQGGFIMGNSTQPYSHTTRASPATVSRLVVVLGPVCTMGPVCCISERLCGLRVRLHHALFAYGSPF